ncbi:MAG: hypothetical protein DRI90_04575, partial [Deltaproteobacteria bacterium]
MSPNLFHYDPTDPLQTTVEPPTRATGGRVGRRLAGVSSALALLLSSGAQSGCAQGGDAATCEQTSECALGETCVAGYCEATQPSGGDGAGGDMELPPIGGSTGEGGSDGSCGEATFELTKTQEVFVVPASVSYMHVKAWGAGANGEGQCSFDDGGLGGFTEGVFQVEPGTP